MQRTEEKGSGKTQVDPNTVKVGSKCWKSDLVVGVDAFPLEVKFGEKVYTLRMTKNKKLILN